MGNILQDMMGLLSRKKVVKKIEETDLLVLGRQPNPEDSMFVTPKMSNELISIKDLRASFDEGEVTGEGTTDFVLKFTDGPNAVVGDSFIKSYVHLPGTGNEENRVEINPTPGPNPNVLIVNTGRFTTVQTDSIVASDTGSVTLNGNVAIGNASTDELTIKSTTNIFDAPIKAGPTPFGNLAPGADYLLVSNAGSGLEWRAQVDIGGTLQTTGTILPQVSAGISGFTYNSQGGFWTRIGDIVHVYLRVSIGTFTKTDPSQALAIQDAFPYDIDGGRYFFNGDLMEYVNISDAGTAIPALYIDKPVTTGANSHLIKFIRSVNYSLTPSNEITTNEMSTGSFVVALSFTYKASGDTLRQGAAID